MAKSGNMSSQNDIGTSSTIKVKEINYETFQDYKKASLLIAMTKCDWKCLKEKKLDYSLCQNCVLAQQKSKTISLEKLYNDYKSNPITKAIIFGGLEPFLQFEEMYSCIKYFRKQGCEDDVVIYTGYYPEELEAQIFFLKKLGNIIIKFGRFDPDGKEKYDSLLGVNLASENQYGKKIC